MIIGRALTCVEAPTQPPQLRPGRETTPQMVRPPLFLGLPVKYFHPYLVFHMMVAPRFACAGWLFEQCLKPCLGDGSETTQNIRKSPTGKILLAIDTEYERWFRVLRFPRREKLGEKSRMCFDRQLRCECENQGPKSGAWTQVEVDSSTWQRRNSGSRSTSTTLLSGIQQNTYQGKTLQDYRTEESPYSTVSDEVRASISAFPPRTLRSPRAGNIMSTMS